jgi:hypothetical protein
MNVTILLAVGFAMLAIRFYLPSERGRDLRRAIPSAVLGLGIAASIQAEDLRRVFVLATMFGAFCLGVALIRVVEWFGSRSKRRVSG